MECLRIDEVHNSITPVAMAKIEVDFRNWNSGVLTTRNTLAIHYNCLRLCLTKRHKKFAFNLDEDLAKDIWRRAKESMRDVTSSYFVT